jgi:hypothetical protein
MTYDEMYTVLKAADMLMTEVDLILWTWQTDLDMMSFIGQDFGVNTYTTPELMEDVTLSVKRVPLVRYEGHKRIVIGVADVDENSGVVRAEVHEDHAEILAIGHQAEYSIADEDPPLYDHGSIKHQLRDLVAPGLYTNPYLMSGLPRLRTRLKLEDIMDLPQTKRSLKGLIPDLDNHPFFKETPND